MYSLPKDFVDANDFSELKGWLDNFLEETFMGGHQEKLQETQESSAAENSWRVLGTITLYVCPLILP